jgi:hypothetical protein
VNTTIYGSLFVSEVGGFNIMVPKKLRIEGSLNQLLCSRLYGHGDVKLTPFIFH